jgi:hypothetical protein
MLKAFFVGRLQVAARADLDYRCAAAAGRAPARVLRLSASLEPEGVLGLLSRHGHHRRGAGCWPRADGDRARWAEIGAITLARFYGLHIWWMPIALLGLIGVHLYLIIRIGITHPPERTSERASCAMNDAEKQEAYLKRYKEKKANGELFFPHSIAKDAIVSLFVFILLIVLATSLACRTSRPPTRPIHPISRGPSGTSCGCSSF